MPAYSGDWHCHKTVPSSAYDHCQQKNEVLFGVMGVLEFWGVFLFGWLVGLGGDGLVFLW